MSFIVDLILTEKNLDYNDDKNTITK